ncbi:hypothetical protein [Halorarius halobius]|uniref:hypothetical protein n=1 Tax=Halorarius halobius TaxID=2962671 RepID=UPI0020CEA509|nr:hypothetical protein [Halorarius halobius]
MSGSQTTGEAGKTDGGWPSIPVLLVVLGQLPLLLFVSGDVRIGVPVSPELLTLLVGEGVLWLVLAGTVLAQRPRGRGVAAFAVATICFGGLLTIGMEATDRLWALAVTLLVVAAVVAYLLHRVELLRLGLAGGDAEP